MLGQRVLVAAIGIPLLALALIAGQPWIVLMIAAFVVAAAVEAAGLLDKAGYSVQPAIAAALAVLMAAAIAFAGTNPGLLPAAWVTAFVLAALVAVLRREPSEGLRRLAGTVLVAAMAASLSMLIAITLHGRLNSQLYLVDFDGGQQLLLGVVLTVWAYDTAAYAVGRFYPRGRFFAHISPKKTWSGATGGLIGAALAGWGLGVLVGRPIQGLGLGVLVGLIAPVGDLAESMLKRAAGVKDSSRVLPGHGGVLDRMDSFLTVAPAAFIYLMLVGLVS